MTDARSAGIARRRLVPLLAASSGAVLVSGCGPAPVPTSAEVGRDPLAVLDPDLWNARSVEELRALPVQGDAAELSAWEDLGGEDSAVDAARDLLATFLGTAYLDPETLRGMDVEESFDHVSQAAPEFWRDALQRAWDEGSQAFYALALAEPFRTVGRPAISAGWFRAEQEALPVLALGLTVAWTAIDTGTRAVGVLAYRLGIVVELDEEGDADAGGLQLTIHGLDGCAMAEQDGLLVPTLADEDRHRDAQKATREQVLDSPRVPLEQLLAEDSSLFTADDETYLRCE